MGTVALCGYWARLESGFPLYLGLLSLSLSLSVSPCSFEGSKLAFWSWENLTPYEVPFALHEVNMSLRRWIVIGSAMPAQCEAIYFLGIPWGK